MVNTHSDFINMQCTMYHNVPNELTGLECVNKTETRGRAAGLCQPGENPVPNPAEFSFARWAENTKSGTHSSGPVEEADVHGSER